MKLSVLGVIVGAIVLALVFFLCAPVLVMAMSPNTGARILGGTVEYTLPPGRKVVTVTWKDEDHSVWILSRPMRPGEKAEEWEFQQHQNLQFLPSGKVLIHEMQ